MPNSEQLDCTTTLLLYSHSSPERRASAAGIKSTGMGARANENRAVSLLGLVREVVDCVRQVDDVGAHARSATKLVPQYCDVYLLT